jgi:hypothetical protein
VSDVERPWVENDGEGVNGYDRDGRPQDQLRQATGHTATDCPHGMRVA